MKVRKITNNRPNARRTLRRLRLPHNPPGHIGDIEVTQRLHRMGRHTRPVEGIPGRDYEVLVLHCQQQGCTQSPRHCPMLVELVVTGRVEMWNGQCGFQGRK